MDWQMWLRRGRDLIFPLGVTCPVCRRLTHGQFLCTPCRVSLNQSLLPPDVRLRHDRLEHLDAAMALWPYDGTAAELVRLLKEHCLAGAAPYLGQYLAEGLLAAQAADHPAARLPALGEEPVITWVTMPDQRQRTRGIDHGRLLAEGTADASGLRCVQLLDRQQVQHHTQRGLTAARRKQNLKGLFRARSNPPKTVVLVDDVLTTGATGEACAGALKEAGAQRVILLAATKA